MIKASIEKSIEIFMIDNWRRRSKGDNTIDLRSYSTSNIFHEFN